MAPISFHNKSRLKVFLKSASPEFHKIGCPDTSSISCSSSDEENLDIMYTVIKIIHLKLKTHGYIAGGARDWLLSEQWSCIAPEGDVQTEP